MLHKEFKEILCLLNCGTKQHVMILFCISFRCPIYVTLVAAIHVAYQKVSL